MAVVQEKQLGAENKYWNVRNSFQLFNLKRMTGSVVVEQLSKKEYSLSNM